MSSYAETNWREIMNRPPSMADDYLDEFWDQPHALEEFLTSIDTASPYFSARELAAVGGPDTTRNNGILKYLEKYKVLGERGRRVLERSRTIESFKTNLRREFAADLERMQQIQKELEDGSRYKGYVEKMDLEGLADAIEKDCDDVGMSVKGGWKATLQNILPKYLGKKLQSHYPIDLADELRALAKNPPPKPPRSEKKGRDTEHLHATADFCLLPMGTDSASVGEHIAECARVLEGFTKRGLKFTMHGYGTNLEGPWHVVSMAIEACHSRLHEQGVPRIATDVRIGTTAKEIRVETTSQKQPATDDRKETTSQGKQPQKPTVESESDPDY